MTTEIKGYIAKDGFWRINAKLYLNDECHDKPIKFIIDSGSQITHFISKFCQENRIRFRHSSAINEIPIGDLENVLQDHCLKLKSF